MIRPGDTETKKIYSLRSGVPVQLGRWCVTNLFNRHLLSPCYFMAGDCSLLLGRKTMTNLDSMLKSRDITLPTKVHLVKAMVFPVVMYGYESWTIKKAEC